MQLLKNIFNWFKLFLALDFIVVSILVLVKGSGEFQKGPEAWGSLLLAFGLFFSAGIFLLIWFYKARKKLGRTRDAGIHTGPESEFYQRYPVISNLFDGWSFNGFGSSYLTYSNLQPDGSLCATKWIICAFIPLVPLYREKIKLISETQRIRIPFFVSSSSLKYQVLDRVELDKKRNVLVRLFYYLFFLPAVILPLILFLVFLPLLNRHFPGPQLWYIIAGYFVWGMFLFFLTELFNKRWFLNRN